MKKLLAIMMALVMCCSLVISASAGDYYSGNGFDIETNVDGEWDEYIEDGYWDYTFESATSELAIDVATEDYLGYTSAEFYDLMLDSYVEDGFEVYEGLFPGFDSFVAEIEEDGIYGTYVVIDLDGFCMAIELVSDDEDEYDSLCDSIIGMTIFTPDMDEDVQVEEDVEIEEEEEEDVEVEEEKKPSKADKDDAEDEDKDTDEKADKDEDKDEEKSDSTLIIIIVAVVAVVAIAAVVIVLATKKKKA